MAEIERILCPIDFSESSEHALRYAIDLASRLSADVRLVHAYQLPIHTLPDGALLARPDLVDELTTELQRQMDELIHRYSGHGVGLQGKVVQGLAFIEVNRVAEEEKADLIVMGTHGRTGMKHLLLGSVAERVVRTAEVPVLTVRHGD